MCYGKVSSMAYNGIHTVCTGLTGVDAEILMPKTEQENALFKTYMETVEILDAYIGLNLERNNTIWIWQDGVSLGYTHWLSGHPSAWAATSSSIQACVSIEQVNSYRWYDDTDCTIPLTAVCQCRLAEYDVQQYNGWTYCSGPSTQVYQTDTPTTLQTIYSTTTTTLTTYDVITETSTMDETTSISESSTVQASTGQITDKTTISLVFETTTMTQEETTTSNTIVTDTTDVTNKKSSTDKTTQIPESSTDQGSTETDYRQKQRMRYCLKLLVP